MILGEPLKRIQKCTKYGWSWKKTSIDYFLPLSNPDQTSEERTFEEDIKMKADDVNEGFEDEERGQLRQSRVEVAE